MWARVVRMPGASSPGFMETIRAAVAAQVPITLASPGNRGAIVLVDPVAGTMLTVTLWETLDALQEVAGRVRKVVDGLEAETGADDKATDIRPWRLVVCDVPARLDPEGHPGDGASPLCARVTLITGDPGPDLVEHARAAASAMREVFFETLGFLGGLQVADPETGRLLTCSVWASSNDLAAATDRLRAGTQGMTIAVGAQSDSAEIAVWEVLACDLPVRVVTEEDDPDP